MNHALKADPKPFNEVIAGTKTFEIRLNDRDYKVGDIITGTETKYSAEDMKQGMPLEYTGHFYVADVLGILHGPVYGLAEGWCIMSIHVTKQSR
jgi:hypothetical protein